jgi:hypothetical protein
VCKASQLTAMVTERASAQPAPSTMVALTYTMVAYDAFAFEGGGGLYSPSGVTCSMPLLGVMSGRALRSLHKPQLRQTKCFIWTH